MDIGYFLKLMTEKGASDMFLTTGAPVNIKVEGKLYPLGNTGLPGGMVKKIAYSLMDEGQVPTFERDLELNLAIAVKDAGRFRINVFKQRGEIGIAEDVAVDHQEGRVTQQGQGSGDAAGGFQCAAFGRIVDRDAQAAAVTEGAELAVPVSITDRSGKEVVHSDITTWVTPA